MENPNIKTKVVHSKTKRCLECDIKHNLKSSEMPNKKKESQATESTDVISNIMCRICNDTGIKKTKTNLCQTINIKCNCT